MPNGQAWKICKIYFEKSRAALSRFWPVVRSGALAAAVFIRKSWKSLLVVVPLFLLLYYAVGSWATHNIDKNPGFKVATPEKGMALTSTVAALIKREVDDKMWTPNLPVIFPGYVLDDMPAYQTGILRSLRVMVRALAGKYDSEDLNHAAEFLDYPPNIWLLSKTENLSLAPSSGAQYRKARKALLRFNNENIQAGVSDTAVLAGLLQAVEKGIGAEIAALEIHVRENSSDWTDNKADDVFYGSQGALYGYYILLNALAEDFKGQILDNGQYEAWTSACKTLENGFSLSPSVVRNGGPSSLLAPNHLLALAYYAAKAQYQISKMAAVIAAGEADDN